MMPLSVSSTVETRCLPLCCEYRSARCAAASIDGVPAWSASPAPRAAQERVVEHGLVVNTLRFVVCRMRCPGRRATSRFDAACARLRRRSGCSLRQCCPRAPGLAACRRSGLNPSRCVRERRSNACPLTPSNLLSPCQRPRDLTVRVCLFAPQPVDHACLACVVSRAGGAMAAAAHGAARGDRYGVASARCDVCACVCPWHVEAVVGRV